MARRSEWLMGHHRARAGHPRLAQADRSVEAKCEPRNASAEGHFVHVFVDRQTRKPVELPPRVRAALMRSAEMTMPE